MPTGRPLSAPTSRRRGLLVSNNTASGVWADTAYRSAANLALLERRGLKPQFQRKKPRGKKMPAHTLVAVAALAVGAPLSRIA